MSDKPAPRFKLPSFKDVQANNQARSAQVSRFKPGLSAATSAQQTRAAQASIPNAPRVPTPPTSNATTSSVPASAPRPALQAVRPPQQPAVPSTAAARLAAAVPAANLQRVVPPGNAAPAPAQPSSTAYSTQIGHGNAVLVNKNQTGNPVLAQMRNINYRFADIIPDYQFNDRTAAIFLSLKFHRLQPTYVDNRIKALQRGFRTFLLCHCDVDDPVNPLAQVCKAALDHHCTLLVAFSTLECSRYLELLKAYENKPVDSLQPRLDTEHTARVASVLAAVRAVNKTDSAAMGTQFRTVASMLKASEEQLSSVPGLGPTKVRRLHAAFSTPFLKTPPAGVAEQGARAAIRGSTAVSGDGVEADEPGVLDEAEQDAREWLATQGAAIEGEVSDDIEDDDFV